MTRRLVPVIGIPYALATALFSMTYVAPRLFLFYKVGWTRVHREHIRILAMPKGRPWPLSNGQAISDGFVIEYLIGIACWFAMFWGAFAMVLLISRLIRRHHQP